MNHGITNPRYICHTVLPNGYVVSTIERDPIMRMLDDALAEITELVGDIGRADLGAEGDFETMVFPGNEDEITDWAELDFARYLTQEDAELGHEQMVKKWREIPAGISRDMDVWLGEEVIEGTS